MNLIRVYRKPNNEIVMVILSPRARRTIVDANGNEQPETDQVFLDRVCEKAMANHPQKDAEFVDLDRSQFPQNSSRAKWRWDDNHPTKIREDLSVITDADRKKTLEDNLDSELAKQSPNSVAVVQMFRDLQKGNY